MENERKTTWNRLSQLVINDFEGFTTHGVHRTHDDDEYFKNYWRMVELVSLVENENGWKADFFEDFQSKKTHLNRLFVDKRNALQRQEMNVH